MKKLNSIKLNGLNKSNLELREMSHIYGGNYCAFGDYNLKATKILAVACRQPFKKEVTHTWHWVFS